MFNYLPPKPEKPNYDQILKETNQNNYCSQLTLNKSLEEIAKNLEAQATSAKEIAELAKLQSDSAISKSKKADLRSWITTIIAIATFLINNYADIADFFGKLIKLVSIEQ